jgi:hypothetical protein
MLLDPLIAATAVLGRLCPLEEVDDDEGAH